MHHRTKVLIATAAAAMVLAGGVHAQEPKPATEYTRTANRALLKELPFEDRTAFEQAERGFIATLSPLDIRTQDGKVAYDGEKLKFLEGDAPDTVNPSLWRQSQLNGLHTGLYEVTDGIYQVRGFDLSNMTLIRGQKGWIVVDPLTSAEPVRAGIELANKHLGARPVSAVVITHSHADHFGGILGAVTAEQVRSGEVPLVAPAGLTLEAISENVVAGNAMVRRAGYMFGKLLPANERGFVSSGLGTTFSSGTAGLLPPNRAITEDVTKMTLDGVDFVFHNVPEAEAPVEVLFYLPQFKALQMAEITSQQMHNVYTIRGAKIRDARLWSQHIHQALAAFGDDAEILFASHHWPIWGQKELKTFLTKQRDLYKFIHDQTMKLANEGYTKEEIAEKIELPDSLAKEFYNRGYYGTVSHNSRAVYTSYLGYFDGNPATLDPLPQSEAAKKYVEFMGGADEVLRKARQTFDRGEYRWTATVLNDLVFAEPTNEAAKNLLADTLEQLGYQAESGPWRNFYLTGAMELRNGVVEGPSADLSKLVLAASVDMIFNALAVRVDPERAMAEDGLSVNLSFTDTDEKWVATLSNGVLHGLPNETRDAAAATLTMSSMDFKRMIGGAADPKSLVEAGKLKVDGDIRAWARMAGVLDKVDPWFALVTPRN